MTSKVQVELPENWIKEALRNHKDKILHKMLRLPLEEPLPLDLLWKLRKAPMFSKVKYSYEGRGGKIYREYVVTPLLRHRAVLAITLKSFHHKRKSK